MAEPDILLTTSLDTRAQVNLANSYLGKHNSVSYKVLPQSDSEETTHFASAYELFELVLRNHHALTLFMSAFAISAGVKVGGLMGKVFEAGAAELGKDVYHWLKTALQRGIQDTKDHDARRHEKNRLGEIRVIIRGVVLDRAPFFAYIYYRYAEIHSNQQLVSPDADARVVQRMTEFFTFVLPFATYLLMTSPELMDGANREMHMSTDAATDSAWSGYFPKDVSFEILPTGEIKAEGLGRKAEAKLVQDAYRKFLDITRTNPK